MIALDTNVLVRFLVQDDPVQSPIATRLIGKLTEDTPGFVSREVLVELVWVLERAYGHGREAVAEALDGLLASVELQIEEANDVASALDLYRRQGFGLGDLMIASAGRRAGAKCLLTFDRKAARLPNVQLLEA